MQDEIESTLDWKFEILDWVQGTQWHLIMFVSHLGYQP